MIRFAIALFIACLTVPAVAADARPNILLIVAEDMSAHIGAFGDKVAQTPTLDALSAQGTNFPNGYTTSGVCAPSRAGLITGVHQVALNSQHMRTSSAFPGLGNGGKGRRHADRIALDRHADTGLQERLGFPIQVGNIRRQRRRRG